MNIDLLGFFIWINDTLLAVPAVLIFLSAAIFLTIKTSCIQIRGIPYFFSLLVKGIRSENKPTHPGTISGLRALLVAMGTTIGMGNVVGPSVAIMAGGPGALFWLIVYILLGSVTKFTEVTYALSTRIIMPSGLIQGGPMRYLSLVSPLLAVWYGVVMIFLFAGWSGIQANTLAQIFAQEGIPVWIVGLLLVAFVYTVVHGGAERVSAIASKLVPLMFVLYVGFAFFILSKTPYALLDAFALILQSAFYPSSVVGGFFGASLITAMRYGIYRGIFITESGVGTAAIPQVLADVKKPTDQGILAMGSTLAETFLALLSGLLVLVTGLWLQGGLRSTLMYEIFKLHSPIFGRVILLASIILFVLTTIIGNSFNGVQTFTLLTRNRFVHLYMVITMIIIFMSSLISMPLIWQIMDTLLTLVAVPHLIGLLILVYKQPQVLNV